MNNPIILFCFHREFQVCVERVKILKKLNPGIPIYALYGGPPEDVAEAQKAMANEVINMQVNPCQIRKWKWLHPDISLKHWYRTYGKQLDFDCLYNYEWDILTTAPLHTIYPPIDEKTLALCAVTEFNETIEHSWDWTNLPEHRPNFIAFMNYMRDTYGLQRLSSMVFGPGPLLPRTFLEAFSATEDNDLVVNEIAYPAYADVLGFTIINNNMLAGFNRPDLSKYFNCDNKPVAYETIEEEMAKQDGKRAFHPVKYLVTAEQLQKYFV